MNEPRPTANTQLRQPWLALARLSWVLIGLASISLFLLGNIQLVFQPPPSCSAPQANCPPATISIEDVQTAQAMGFPFSFMGLYLSFSILARVLVAGTAIIIFWRRSDDWLALMLSGALMSVLIEGGFSELQGAGIVMALMYGIGTALFLPIPFVFPNGQVEPRWMRWIVIALTVSASIAYFMTNYDQMWFGPASVLILVWTVLSIYAMVYRYTRVSNPTERQQIRWVLMGISAALIVGVIWNILVNFWPVSQPSPARILGLLINGVTYLAGYGFMAFGILVAMLRYRLWDIDLLIRRTLQYTLLTGLLALLYFGGVVVLQGVLGPLTGQADSPLVAVITTLGVAALFNPLRIRIQDFIDRRFYRRKYDAEKALASFAQVARSQTGIEELSAEVIAVASETTQPERVSLWLRRRF
jgi:hypothetical protein